MTIQTTVVIRGAQEIIAALQRVQQQIPLSGQQMGRRLTSEGLDMVMKLTPRQANASGRAQSSKRGRPPFHTQWTFMESTGNSGSLYQSVIFNRAATSGGPPPGQFSSPGHRALGAVEWGAKPHTISATRPHGRLAWNEPSTARRTATTRAGGLGTTIRPPRTRTQGGDILQHTQLRSGRGSVIVRGSVRHPGHGGFYMVRDTRRYMQDLQGRILTQFANQVGAAFMSPSAIFIS